MLLAPTREKKMLSSMNWTSCSLFLQPSLASLTRPPSFDFTVSCVPLRTLLTRGSVGLAGGRPCTEHE